MTAAPPVKLFREEAQAETVKCLSCGGPIALHSFGARQRVVCPHGGSTLAPADSGALTLLEAASRAQQQSVLPLHARGTLAGVEWEIIGICWRRCVVDGIAYPWQEFLLFNPWRGVRWLIYSNSDGHWQLGHNLDGAPEIRKTRHHSVRFAHHNYRHFQGAVAVVSYVEGEFTWEVHVGDQAEINDFVAPPLGLSIEQSSGPDGVELNFTAAEHLDAADVWRAFKRPGKPPRTRGVGALAPNPWHRIRRSMWLSGIVFFAAWWLLSARLKDDRHPIISFRQDDISFDEPFSREVTIGQPGTTTAIEFSLSANPLDNAWAYADVLLVNLATQDAIGFGLEASYDPGVDGGESWSEGSTTATAVIGGVEGGQYLLQITPQRGGTGSTPFDYDVKLTQDIYLHRYAVLSLLIILCFPLLTWLLGWLFERRRWKNSDYSGD